MKTLSIIVPTYNVEHYIERCLCSFPIDRDDLEVLVIIDGSKDDSAQKAKAFQDKYPTVFHVIEKENGHYGSCINVGLSLAQGKYIKVLDADDFFSENFTEYLDFVASSDADLLLSDSSIIKTDRHGVYYRFNLPGYAILGLNRLENKDLYDLPHQCIAYKTDLLRAIHYTQTEGMPYTDLEWISYPIVAVNTIAYFPKVVYEYDLTREGQSVSQISHCREMGKDCIIVEKMAAYYERVKSNIPDENRRVLGEIVFSNITRLYFHFLINWPNLLDNEVLIRYDTEIKRLTPELYQRADTVTERRKYMSFRYIHEWRKHQNRKTLAYRLFDLRVLLGRIASRIKLPIKNSGKR